MAHDPGSYFVFHLRYSYLSASHGTCQ